MLENDTPTSPTPSCTGSTGAISASTFTAAGGTGSVSVTAGSTCAWTSTSSATFVTITAGSSGTGNGTATSRWPRTPPPHAPRRDSSGHGVHHLASGGRHDEPINARQPVRARGDSPIGGAAVTVARPPLTVSNAAATGTVGTVTYRFEISDQATFPNDAARTFSESTASHRDREARPGTVPRDLGTNVLWYWHARATDGTVTSAYSATETFSTGPRARRGRPGDRDDRHGGGTVTVTVTRRAAARGRRRQRRVHHREPRSSGTGGATVTATVAAGSGAPRSEP